MKIQEHEHPRVKTCKLRSTIPHPSNGGIFSETFYFLPLSVRNRKQKNWIQLWNPLFTLAVIHFIPITIHTPSPRSFAFRSSIPAIHSSHAFISFSSTICSFIAFNLPDFSLFSNHHHFSHVRWTSWEERWKTIKIRRLTVHLKSSVAFALFFLVSILSTKLRFKIVFWLLNCSYLSHCSVDCPS